MRAFRIFGSPKRMLWNNALENNNDVLKLTIYQSASLTCQKN